MKVLEKEGTVIGVGILALLMGGFFIVDFIVQNAIGIAMILIVTVLYALLMGVSHLGAYISDKLKERKENERSRRENL